MAKKGDWVLTHTIVLTPDQRAPQVPEDTHKVPLEMWVKGHLTADAEIGDTVSVVTRAGREVSGKLLAVNPRFDHDFGDCVPELLEIGDVVRGIVFGGDR